MSLWIISTARTTFPLTPPVAYWYQPCTHVVSRRFFFLCPMFLPCPQLKLIAHCPSLYPSLMASKFNFFSLYLFVAFQRVNSNNGTCYYPDGTINIGDHPCDPNADVSMCCSDISQCLTNGLCALGDTTSRSGISFARGTCTDESWESEICPQHCRVSTLFPYFPLAYLASSPVPLRTSADS